VASTRKRTQWKEDAEPPSNEYPNDGRARLSLSWGIDFRPISEELLRHANSRITLDLNAQAGMPNKRLALVRMVLNKGEALA